MRYCNQSTGWKRILALVLKVYAGLCTAILTAYLLLGVCLTLFTKSSEMSGAEAQFMMSYGTYMAKEHPYRSDRFSGMAHTLDWYAREIPVSRADLLKYLGDPDLSMNSEIGRAFVYFHDRSDVSNRWAVYIALSNGIITTVGYNDATVNDHSEYRPYEEDSQQPDGAVTQESARSAAP